MRSRLAAEQPPAPQDPPHGRVSAGAISPPTATTASSTAPGGPSAPRSYRPCRPGHARSRPSTNSPAHSRTQRSLPRRPRQPLPSSGRDLVTRTARPRFQYCAACSSIAKRADRQAVPGGRHACYQDVALLIGKDRASMSVPPAVGPATNHPVIRSRRFSFCRHRHHTYWRVLARTHTHIGHAS